MINLVILKYLLEETPTLESLFELLYMSLVIYNMIIPDW